MNWKEIKERATRATPQKILRKAVHAPRIIFGTVISAPTTIGDGWRRFLGLDWLKATVTARYQEYPFKPKSFLISNELIKTASQCHYLLYDFTKPAPAPCEKLDKKILFCSVFAGNYVEKFQSIIDERIEYCRKHGYAFALMKEAPACFRRPYPWLRIPFIYKLMQDGYDHIFYLDADAFITNPETRLEEFFSRMTGPSSTSFFLCIDGHGNINTGSFFIRKTRGAQGLLDLVWQNVKFINHQWWENGSFIDLYQRLNGVRKITLLTRENRLFNSFDRYNDPWQEGDFILHLAGYREEELTDKLEFYRKSFAETDLSHKENA